MCRVWYKYPVASANVPIRILSDLSNMIEWLKFFIFERLKRCCNIESIDD